MASKLINFLRSQSFKKDFRDFMEEMESKYGPDIMEECGIGNQLDIASMSKHFFNSKVTADVSVDANANVSDTSVISHRVEMAKPFQLINSYYRIYKDLKKRKGVEYAKKLVESQISGRIYINDFHAASSGMCYCFNYSTYDTALLGIPSTFDGRGGSKPPKNLMSFLGQIELFSLIAGNIDGETYKADMKIVQKMQDIYIDIMNRELARKPITFPVSTACFAIDDEHNIMDEDFLQYIAEKNLKFGFINMYSGKSSTLSSCCRLRSEQDNEYFNSFGSGSTKIGSLSVSSGNLPQLAFKVKSEPNAREVFLDKLKELVIDCAEINQTKRNLIKKAIKANAQPLYTLGYMDLGRQYSTFGVVGLYEALQILGMNIKSEEGKEFTLKMLDIINTINKEMQDKFKAPHNCEQIPAENVAVKLAKKDRILGYNSEYDLYSNQFIPLIERTNMLDRIEMQGIFDSHFSGGAICHLNMDQEIKDVKVMADLIKTCAKKHVVYFAINYVLQECEDGHLSVGNVETCPICGKPIKEKYTRVVGFLTPVGHWNKTRREVDFPNRQFYSSISA